MTEMYQIKVFISLLTF